MRKVILSLSLLLCLCANAQPTAKQIQSKYPAGTQGAAENQQVLEFFETQYEPQVFARYTGAVRVQGNSFTYVNSVLEVYSLDPALRPLFTRGLLNTSVVTGLAYMQSGDSVKFSRPDTMRISNLKDLSDLDPSPRQKRFRFWLYTPGFANPHVCFFELTNDRADAHTSLADFLAGARLTFYKKGWVII